MSLKQVYTSAVFPYELLGDERKPFFWYPGTFGGDNPYFEQIWWINGLVVAPRPNVHSNRVITVIAIMKTTGRQGAIIKRFDFSFTTGEYLPPKEEIKQFDFWNFLTTQSIQQMRDGSVWALTSSLNLYKLDPESFAFTGQSYTVAEINGGENTNVRGFTLDEPNNRVVIATWDRPNDEVTVRELSTGNVLHRVRVAGIVEHIFPEDGTRVYVMSKSGLLTLVDYASGEPLGVFKVALDPPADNSSNQIKVAWDRFLHRILVISHTAEATDGASTTQIKGYFPQPLPAGITDPLPLVMPIKGRSVPILTHVYGEAGEPISGKPVTATFTGPATSNTTVKGTDGFGDALFPTTATDAGLATINFSVEV
jgi:hypothetical protein